MKMTTMAGAPTEQSPLVATRVALAGTARFPFHPEAPSTPWWRRLCFRFFDDPGEPLSVQLSDMWELPRDLQSSEAAEELRRSFVACGRRLMRAVWRTNRSALVWSVVLALGATVLRVLYPLLLFHLLSIAVSEERVDLWRIMAQIALMFVVTVAHVALTCHSDAQMIRVSVRLTGGLRALLLREIIMHGARRPERGSGQSRQQKQRLADLAMVYEDDCRSFASSVSGFNNGWTNVAELIVDVGVIVFLVGVPWQILVVDGMLFGAVWATERLEGSSLNASWRQKLAVRLSAVHECFGGMQNVKFNAWEHKMQHKIERARHEEVQQLRQLSYLRALASTLGSEVSGLAAALTFAWMALLDRPLTPMSAFTILIRESRSDQHRSASFGP
ncbi:hypothetical protein P43SY_004166 [Pythium insidiosum]|uniref:ABC transmembrane type-1 domain-containing protein n=1 Tax=Pythium insidiosum TaxID=114742 RepID=A0AAD5LUP0_PYTIN|nr:hypothetical protein P43SY_004166 [Pythium insidiosum]